MLHGSTVSVKGNVDNAQAALDALRNLDERCFSIYAARSKSERDQFRDIAHKDLYFDAKGALEAGLVDEIIYEIT